MPASTPNILSVITDKNALVADDISSLEQSLPQGCSLDELMRCSVQQPGDLRSVGPEQDVGTIENSSDVHCAGFFDAGGSSFACGGENDSLSSFSSNWFTSLRGRNHSPALTSMQRKH